MKLEHSLSLLVVSLCFLNAVRCDDILITARPRWQYGDTKTIDIKFPNQLFRNFYECLCKATAQQCSVNLSYSWSRYYATNVHRYDYQVQPNKENLSCKYYKCSYIYSNTFICTTEESHSCGSSPRTQSLQYRSANCGDTKCVSISWDFTEENVDYSRVQSTVYSCNNICGCSTRAPVRPITIITTTTEKPHTSTTKRKTSLTSKQTTTTEIQKTSQAEATSQTTVTLNAGKQTTIQEIGDNTETNATASGVVSNSRIHDPIPIIAGVVAASILVASIAVVVFFLWKRKKSAAQKPASDCHEYANLPFGTTNAVNLSQDLSSQHNNYATVNCSFDYDLEDANYATLSYKTNDNTVQTDNQPYVSSEPSKILAVAPKECNQTREASTAITDGYVIVTNTLEETDDFDNSIYELAHHCSGTDPGLAGASIPNTETKMHDLYSENRTEEPSSNDRGAAVSTKLCPNKDHTYENDTSYPAENTNTEPRIDLQNLKQANIYLHDYESVKPTKESVSITDSIYSVSNDDVNSGYVTVTKTLGENYDFANSIYELAHCCPGTDPGLAGASIPNTETNLHDLYSENRTEEPSSNDRGAAVSTKLCPNKDHTYKNDTSYRAENTNTEPPIDMQNLEQARNYLHDYKSAKPTKESDSITDSIYSVSNDDVNSETTYSIAANPARHTDDSARPHVYAHLGKDTHNIVNPYNILQQANEPPVPLLAKIQNITLGKSSDTIQPYSLAEPIYEYQPRSGNDNLYQAIDSTDDDDEQCTDTYTTPYEDATRGISSELFNKSNNPSGYQMPNDSIYFELEK